MTAAQIKAAVEQINRVEKQMIAEMTEDDYRAYMAIPEDTRKMMLYMAQKAAA
jgi:hypothetical protein